METRTGNGRRDGRARTYVALLRGINVSGHRMLRMEDLRALATELGHRDVRTYVQSGNLIFRAAEAPAGDLGAALKEAIAARFGLDVPVLVVPGSDLADAAAANPFLEEGADGRTLHVTFLAGEPDPERLRAIPAEAYLPDRFRAERRHVYVQCMNGYRNTKLHNGFFEARLGCAATTRNWNTVLKLADLAAEGR